MPTPEGTRKLECCVCGGPHMHYIHFQPAVDEDTTGEDVYHAED